MSQMWNGSDCRMTTDGKIQSGWQKETMDNLVNRGDPNAVVQCPSCGMYFRGGHPCQKPAVLYTRPIENHLEQGDPFYEPFAGSGTGIVAAEQTGRRCRAIELEPKYVQVAIERWQKFTGQKARKE